MRAKVGGQPGFLFLHRELRRAGAALEDVLRSTNRDRVPALHSTSGDFILLQQI